MHVYILQVAGLLVVEYLLDEKGDGSIKIGFFTGVHYIMQKEITEEIDKL